MANSLALSGGQLGMPETFHLLESSDLGAVEEAVALIRDNLGSGTEPLLLSGLVEFYIQSGNCHARDLLCMARQQQHKVLLSKIDDYLQKVSTRLKALNLLEYIVRSDPPWIHHIPRSKTFLSVLKCLQVDTDLPTVTSALYVIATAMPKVAGQVSPHLTSICAIFARLASWHSIKPAGANEGCLVHLHRGVYALFLCLYGMFPCYFTGFLHQYFQAGGVAPKSGNAPMKGLSDAEKLKIFQRSVAPMFDQVRLHPRLIMESSSVELSNLRWRKVESQEIIADISKLALDATENPALATSRHLSISDVYDPVIEGLSSVCLKQDTKSRGGSDADNPPYELIEIQDTMWSPSIAIGLSTPPLSRALSPALGPTQPQVKPNEGEGSEEPRASGRPLTLTMPPVDSFVPNRPHDTSSRATTPLKQLVSFFSQSPSTSQCPTPQKEREKKRSGGKESAGSSEEATKSRQSSVAEDLDEFLKKSPLNIQDPGLHSPLATSGTAEPAYPSVTKPFHDVSQTDAEDCTPVAIGFTQGPSPNSMAIDPPDHQDADDVIVTSAHKLLNLTRSCDLVGKSPNQLLDDHVRIVAEAYSNHGGKMSLKDAEWLPEDFSPDLRSEVIHLRSEVIQMQCAMLYERHRREQHALRSRKLMRKVYDTTALEEKSDAMGCQLAEMRSEIEDHRSVEASYRSKLKTQEEHFASRIDELTGDVERCKMKNQELVAENRRLQFDKQQLLEQSEALKSESARTGARLFAAEERLKMDRSDKEQVVAMETRIKDLQSRLLEVREANCILEDRVKEAQGAARARAAEGDMLLGAYKRDLEAAKAFALTKERELARALLKLEHAECGLKRKDDVMAEQKKYLEDVKSLARGQIKAVEAKYKTQKLIGQRLEIQLLEAFARLSTTEGELPIGGQLQTGATSFQTIPSSSDQQEHPCLTPPIRGSLLADESLWTPHLIWSADKSEAKD